MTDDLIVLTTNNIEPESTDGTEKSGSHTHVVVIDAQTGDVHSSIDKGHSHIITYTAEGDIIVAPAKDGHTHKIAREVKDKVITEEDEEKFVAEVYSNFATNYELNKDNIARAEESERFMMLKHWTPAQAKKLANDGLPALTTSFAQANINIITGIMKKNTLDIGTVPTEEGDKETSALLNIIFKNVLNRNDFAFHYGKVADDQVIVGNGDFLTYVDTRDNGKRDIKITRTSYKDVLPGPHELENLSDCPNMIVMRWFDVEEIKALYPDLEEEIDGAMKSPRVGLEPIVKGSYADIVKNLVNDNEQKLRVLEFHKKRKVNISSIILANKRLVKLPLISREIRNKLKTIPTLQLQDKVMTYLTLTRVVGGLFLSHEHSIFSDFLIAIAYAMKRGQEVLSTMDLQKDVQREFDVRRSHATALVKYMLNQVVVLQEGAVDDVDEFTKAISKPGSVVTVRDPDPNARIKPIDTIGGGSTIPPEMFKLMSMDQDNMRKLLNLDTVLNDNGDSGILFVYKQQQALIGNEYLFANMRLALKKVGERILEAVPLVYFNDPERLWRLVQNSAERDTKTNLTKEDIERIISTVDINEYDVVVTESPHTKTQRQLDMHELVTMLQHGGIDQGLAQDIYFELSNFAKSGKIGEHIEAFRKERAKQMTPSESEVVKGLPDSETEYKKAKVEGAEVAPNQGQDNILS